MMERDALTTNPAASPAAMPARASAPPPWARYPAEQERVGQSLPHEAQLRRRGGAGDRTHVAVTGLAHVRGAQLSHQIGDAQEQRPPVDLDLLQERGAGVARAREDEDAVAVRAVVHQRLGSESSPR